MPCKLYNNVIQVVSEAFLNTVSVLQNTQVCTLYCMKASDDPTSIAFHHHCRALQSCVTSAFLHPAELGVAALPSTLNLI